MSGRLAIGPETRVAELLAAYPELEEVLVAAAPAFAKLRNPVLRRTVAKVTSLRRAAEVAGISTRDLVLALRRAAGLDDGDTTALESEVAAAEDAPAPWVDAARVRWTVDADALIEAGRQPIAEVEARVAILGQGDLGLVRSSFRPAPLVELLENRGFRVAIVAAESGFATFIGRTPQVPS